MSRRLAGQTITVRRPAHEGFDDMGEQIVRFVDEEVADVLVAAGATLDSRESNRPHGTSVEFTLAFPKTYSKSLRGCRVVIEGEEFEVIGDPRAHPAHCPTRWNRKAEVTRLDG